MKKLRLLIGYALIAVAIICLILMLVLWFYMIWTPEYDRRLEGMQTFLFCIMFLFGWSGGVLVSFK